MKYYLMDLERSVGTGEVYFWKGNRYGYTKDIETAGLFDETEAERIVKEDFNKRTVMVSEKIINDIKQSQ